MTSYNSTIFDELLDERDNFSLENLIELDENENENNLTYENVTNNNLIEEEENVTNNNLIEEEENVTNNNLIEENENVTNNNLIEEEEKFNLNNFIKENQKFTLNTLEILINKMMTLRDEKIKKLKNTCCICLNKESTYIYINCGHYCLCSKCKHKYDSNICPKCREIGRVIKVFK